MPAGVFTVGGAPRRRMIPRVFAAAAPVLLVLGGSGCGAGWHRVEPPAGGVPARQQVQVWHDDRFERWHAVTVGPDSITGVPYWRRSGAIPVGWLFLAPASIRSGSAIPPPGSGRR